jgi:hypothetical protein
MFWIQNDLTKNSSLCTPVQGIASSFSVKNRRSFVNLWTKKRKGACAIDAAG